jgi:hypothetical protein
MIRYVADEALRGNLPFPRYAYLLAAMLVYMLCSRQKNCRAREDELLYILRKLSELKLWPGTLWAATSNAPSTHSLQQPREYLSSIMLTQQLFFELMCPYSHRFLLAAIRSHR